MKTPIDFQIIEQNGEPAFAVVPYAEFIRLIRPKTTIPHEVVRANVVEGVPLTRAWREYLRLTQLEVAEKAGITQAALSQLENPKARPRKATLEKLAHALDLSVEQLRE
ncbi:MAG: helix-turn-helix domain-containing protein [Nitrospinales bacterium]